MKLNRALAVGLGFCALAIGGMGWWTWTRETTPERAAARQVDSAAKAAVFEQAADPKNRSATLKESGDDGSASHLPPTPDVVAGRREQAAPAAFELGVVGPSGQALSEVEVSWDVLDNDVLGYFEAPEAADWLWRLASRTNSISSKRQSQASDGAGLVAFDAAPPGASVGGSVLWLTHPDWLARAVLLDPAADPWPDAPLELEPARTAWVEVVDRSGQAVEGARVVQQALLPDGVAPGTDDMRLRVRRALVRELRTDSDGRARLHAISGKQWVQAEHAGKISRCIDLEGPRDTVLVLEDMMTVGGRVVSSDGSELGPYAIVTVRGALLSSDEHVRLGSHPVLDGAYGPIELPLDPGLRGYRLELFGGDNAVSSEFVEFDEPGAHRQVDLVYEAGYSMWWQTVDKRTEEPIEGARFSATWQDANGRSSGFEMKSRAQGWISINGFPRARPHTVVIQAPGYLPYSNFDQHYIAEYEGAAMVAMMTPAHSLALRVSRDGKAATAYRALLTKPGGFQIEAQIDIEHSGDGRSSFQDLWPGTYWLTVTTSDQGVLDGMEVQVPCVDGAELEVELTAGRVAIGRVLNAKSGAPVVAARVCAAFCPSNFDARVESLSSVSTDSDGRFRLAGYPNGAASVRVEAEGFVAQDLGNATETASGLDFGVIPLRSSEPKELFLQSEGRPLSGPYTVRLGTDRDGTWISFDAKGRAAVDGSSGPFWVEIRHPEGTIDRYVLPESARTDEGYAIDVARDRKLRIRFLDESGDLVPRSGSLALRAALANGVTISRHLDSMRPFAEVLGPALPASRAQVLWHSVDAEQGIEAVVALGDERLQTIELENAHAPIRVLCLDQYEVPLEGASADVLFYPSQAVAPFQYRAESDSDGMLLLHVPSVGAYSVVVQTSGGSSLVSLTRAELEAGPSPYRLVLRTDHSLALRVASGGAPLEGAMAYLLDKTNSQWIAQGHSNAQGLVSFRNLGSGEFTIRVRADGHWPVIDARSSGLDEAPQQVELLPTKSCTLVLLDAAGNPLSKARVELVHSGLSQSVADWLLSGLLEDWNAYTDASGRLAIVRLPLGAYRWGTTVDGRTHAGSFVLDDDRDVISSRALP